MIDKLDREFDEPKGKISRVATESLFSETKRKQYVEADGVERAREGGREESILK
jgi:hypothetical protein